MNVPSGAFPAIKPAPSSPSQAPAVASDVTGPVIGALSLSRGRFRAARSGRSLKATAARRRRRAPVGTTIRYTLSEPATVRSRIERKLKGRRLKRGHKRARCVKQTHKNRRRRRCTR